MSGEKVVVRVEEKLKPLVPRFLQNREAEVVELREHAEVGDVEELSRAGHALKGTASSFGFDRLAELAQELEARAEDDDAEGAAEVVEAIADHLDRIEVAYD